MFRLINFIERQKEINAICQIQFEINEQNPLNQSERMKKKTHKNAWFDYHNFKILNIYLS